METPSTLDRLKGVLQQNWKSWGILILAGILIIGLAYLLYTTLTPSRTQASVKAKPTFAAATKK